MASGRSSGPRGVHKEEDDRSGTDASARAVRGRRKSRAAPGARMGEVSSSPRRCVGARESRELPSYSYANGVALQRSAVLFSACSSPHACVAAGVSVRLSGV